MTPEQQKTIDERKAQGFQVVGKDFDGTIRIVKGADQRVVFTDGGEKRGQHDFIRRWQA
jgi:hypothetical protein